MNAHNTSVVQNGYSLLICNMHWDEDILFFVFFSNALRFHSRTNKDNLLIHIDARRHVTLFNCISRMNLNITDIKIFILYEYLSLLFDIEILIVESRKAVLCVNRPRFSKQYDWDGYDVAASDFLTCVSKLRPKASPDDYFCQHYQQIAEIKIQIYV